MDYERRANLYDALDSKLDALSYLIIPLIIYKYVTANLIFILRKIKKLLRILFHSPMTAFGWTDTLYDAIGFKVGEMFFY